MPDCCELGKTADKLKISSTVDCSAKNSVFSYPKQVKILVISPRFIFLFTAEAPQILKKNNNQSFRFLLQMSERFDLHEDIEDEQETMEYISKNEEFKCRKLRIWILHITETSIRSIISPKKCIIEVMLISPVMSPTMGIGMRVGFNNFYLLIHSLRNLEVSVFRAI